MRTIRKVALLAGASSVFIAGAAFAQTQIAAPSRSATAQDAADEPVQSVGEIVVTGSRIVHNGYTAPTPVTVAPIADLQLATPTNIPDALNKLPQFLGSTGPRSNAQLQANSGDHGNLLNLRGVGANRVLVLLDGLRVPPTTYRGAVDSNVIPQLLVQRVDVVTAGASAAYGSDAVSGVVNYVLDTNFSGIKGVAQYGASTQGDLQNYRIGIAGGMDFAGGRGHIIASAEHFDTDGIVRGDREYAGGQYAAVGSIAGSTAAPGTAANPLVFIKGGQSRVETFGGLINSSTVPSLVNQIFNPNGTIRPIAVGAPTGTPGIYIGGDGFHISDTNTLIAPLTTNQAYARASYKLTDDLTVYAQGNYAKADTSYLSQANYILGGRIYSGNAFLDPSVQALMGPNDSFTIFEYLEDAGPLPTTERTESSMFTAGIKGVGPRAWTWNLDYTHGWAKTEVAQYQFNLPKLYAALDAVRGGNNSIVCRVSTTASAGLYPGCVPINVFGQGAPSQAALDYVRGYSRYSAENKTDDVAFTAQGDLFQLPAGPISAVVGAEYRKQTLNLTSNADPAVPANFTGLRGQPAGALNYSATNVGQAHGQVTVKEAFAEVAVPILGAESMIGKLDFNAAGRVTDYSTSGRVETWKLGATWRPIDDVLFRITKSRDIRAPSLFDLFAGAQTIQTTIVDPHTNVTNTVVQYSGGNPNLNPEEGDTFTTGVVWSPSFVPGFSVSLDYYHLRIEGAIATQTVADMLTECEVSGGTSPTCALIVRPGPFSDRSAGNFPTSINVVNQNISFIDTTGFDLDASYRRDLGDGKLSLRLYGTYAGKYETQNSAAAPVYDYAGYGANGTVNYARPKIRGSISANYEIGNWTFFAQETMIGKVKFGPTQVYAEDAIDPVFYTDATVAYKVPQTNGAVELFATATNLFDKSAPLAPNVGVPGLYYPTLFSVYDIAGRTITAGARFRF